MTRTICFDAAAILHDRRFRRKLTKFEGMDFVFFLGFAASECRDPAFIPAKKMEDLALDLGWTGKAGEEQKRKRLAKWSAPGIELIEIQEDGGIQINYLLDQEFEQQEEKQQSQVHPAHSNGTSGTNGNGTEKRNEGERRQQNRRYAENSAAERSRKSYWERKRQDAGGDFSPDGEFENLTTETENLTLSTGKPHASGEENGANFAENLTRSREVSPARAQDVKDVVGDLKDSLSSDYVSNVPREKNLTQNLTGKNLTPAGQNLTSPPLASGSRPPAPAIRPALRPQDVPAQRHFDVRHVLKATGDDPAKWGAQWKALWNHCCSHDNLRCWDVGVVYFAWRLKVSPGSGPGAIIVNATWLRGTILNQLEQAGAPYVSTSKGDAPPAEPVDPEEQARVHQEIMDIKAGWEAEEQARESARRGVITPLEVREDKDTYREMEDEE